MINDFVCLTFTNYKIMSIYIRDYTWTIKHTFCKRFFMVIRELIDVSSFIIRLSSDLIIQKKSKKKDLMREKCL